MSKHPWTCALALDSKRRVISGSTVALADAIRRGAALRVYTEFYYEEHVAPFFNLALQDQQRGLVKELMDFPQVYLLDDRHVAGITSMRQATNPLLGFNGIEPRMSYFLYNMTAQQACANLMLGEQSYEKPGRNGIEQAPADVPKLGEQSTFDHGSSGPSRNFTYEMETYRFMVCDDWELVLAHDEQGRVIEGSWDALSIAHEAGRHFKVAIRNVASESGTGPDHEVFAQLSAEFLHTNSRVYEAQTHPIVRVRPAVPLEYGSQNWDVTWLWLGTHGKAQGRTLDPHTRRFHDWTSRFACRWFAR